MIARNETRKRRAKVVDRVQQQQAAHQMSQITINAVLWQIIRQNAKTSEGDDYDATKPAALTIPMEEFKDVPGDFGLQVKQDKDGNVIIIANGVEPKSNIFLPDRKIIGG